MKEMFSAEGIADAKALRLEAAWTAEVAVRDLVWLKGDGGRWNQQGNDGVGILVPSVEVRPEPLGMWSTGVARSDSF
jgi:hypothetical protein